MLYGETRIGASALLAVGFLYLSHNIISYKSMDEKTVKKTSDIEKEDYDIQEEPRHIKQGLEERGVIGLRAIGATGMLLTILLSAVVILLLGILVLGAVSLYRFW